MRLYTQVSPNSGGDGAYLRVVPGDATTWGNIMSSGSYVTEQIWRELLHEIGTVRALAAAALETRSEETRVALLTLLEAETAEVSALLQEVGHTTGPASWTGPEGLESQWAS